MEIKIDAKTEQPLHSRTLIEGIVAFEAATPSRSDVRKKLSEALKVSEAAISVKKLGTNFGEKSARFAANVYKSREDLEKGEPKFLLSRGSKAAKKDESAEASPEKAEAKAEKKAEEKKQ